MLSSRTISAALPLLLLLAACAGGRSGSGDTGRFRDRSVLTHEQLNEVGYNDAYQAIEALRSHWLRTRGPASPHGPGQVAVYLNNTRLGGVEALRGISTQEIVYVRFYDAVSAAGRWGRDVTHGVIYVSTERP